LIDESAVAGFEDALSNILSSSFDFLHAFADASACGLVTAFALCDIISDFLDEFLETFV
tara:strand:+ start:234 stop:410 length:177 start_codon:yes stop_codon:yes gene_type:complete